MSTKKTLFIFSLASLFLMGLILFNVFSNKREFIVITVKDTDVCFLADASLKIDLSPQGLAYSQGKNSGFIQVFRGESKMREQGIRAMNNGFESNYYKTKNLRQYQYKVDDHTIIQDDFVYAQKFPLNLVPYRGDCPQFLKSHKQRLQI